MAVSMRNFIEIMLSVAKKSQKYKVSRVITQYIYRILKKLFRTKVLPDAKNARQVLEQISPKPRGHLYWDTAQEISDKQFDLSIIVPFYKTENYARRCIESILTQDTTYSFELILINDGSPDNCGKIINSYSTDYRVRVIHKENEGVAAARNVGITVARGKYLLFVDSDDFIFSGTLHKLLEAAFGFSADVVEGGFAKITNTKEKTFLSHKFSVGNCGVGMSGYPCGKLFHCNMFQKYCFPTGYWYEDTIISSIILPQANVSVTIEDLVYGYYMNPRGATNLGKVSPKCIDTYYIVEEILKEYETMHNDLTTERKQGMLRQLGPYLYNRIKGLSREQIVAVFVSATNLSEKYGLTDFPTNNFFEKELIKAIENKNFLCWKWASIFL